ncbi:MAG: hypothetical protein RLZZ546_1369 [Bacteroidota bacterium]|jgi:hypothetical protein
MQPIQSEEYKRDFRKLTWEHTPVEEYDLVRHFVELNDAFPSNILFVGNDSHGYVSYELMDKKIKEAGGKILFKSVLHKTGIRKCFYLLNNDFILLESIYSKNISTFINLPEELNNGQYVTVTAQLTILYATENPPQDILDIIEASTLQLASYPTVGIISRDGNGFFLNEIILEAEICQDLDLHYGEGFNLFHEKLMKRLLTKNKGISLFHGIHGSGKSYYINRLIYDLKQQSNKKIVLVPTNMVSYLLEPDFNTFLMDMVNDSVYEKEELGEALESDSDIVNGMIFILEDAEPVLLKREEGMSGQSTSNILNLTDGLLNTIFKIQIIATYNTDDDNIDPAIKRDKRLIAKREFKELSLADSKKLGESIGIVESDIIKPMTVAQIYSLTDKEDDEVLIEDKRKKEPKTKAGLKLD